MSKLLTVFGATGQQGGSVVREVLADMELSKAFRIRAITRNTSNANAKNLSSQGVEVVSADMTSKDSVEQAVRGSHTVYFVTLPNFTGGPSQELIQGKNVADAAKAAGVQHVIFPSLKHVTKATQGRLPNVLHYDLKADVETYIRSLDLPCTFVQPGYYMSNFIDLHFLKKGPDGVYTFAAPVSEKAPFPLFDTRADMGKYVVAVMRNRADMLGKSIPAASDYYTPARIMSEFEEVTGKKGRYMQVEADKYKTFLPPPMAQEILENHFLLEDTGYFASENLDDGKALLKKVGMKPTTWKEFIEENKDAFE